MPTIGFNSGTTRAVARLTGAAATAAIIAATIWAVTGRSTGFMPHGHCYLWHPPLLAMHVGSDLLIGLAYVSISVTLAILVVRAQAQIPFSWMMLLFGAFIIACGATHFIDVWTVWHPSYWLSAWVKVITAAVSVGTAVLLPPLVPVALGLADDAALSAERQRARQQAVEALQEAQLHLEERVLQRTHALSEANQALATEIAARERAQAAAAHQANRIRTLYEVAAEPDASTGDQVIATLRLGCKWFGMDVGAVHRIDGAHVTTCYDWSSAGATIEGRTTALDASYAAFPAAAKRAVAFHDITQSPYATASARKHTDMRAYIGVPLVVDGAAYGTLDFASAAAHAAPCDPADLECIGLLSRWIAAAIERDAAERTVAEARDRAVEASRLKSEFVSTMSHELRTPLNIILGYAELTLDDGSLGAEQRQALECIRRSGLDLLDLITATLDVARVENGLVEATIAPCLIHPLFERLDGELRPLAPPGVQLFWDSDPLAKIETDGKKLHTILKNLAGNALKFTSSGSVRIEYRSLADGSARFLVRDSGIGIPSDQLPVIFDMFRQVDGSSTRRYEGVGLGLYIVKSLLDVLGGEITVESTVGVGTTFTVLLPAVAAAASTAA